jgi:RiboL-PSP-HEPN
VSSNELTEFTIDLDRVRRLLNLLAAFRDFGGSANPAEATPPLEWPEASALHVEASNVRPDLPLMAGAILLYVAGRFEYYVRQCVEVVAAELASKATSFSQLPEGLRKAYQLQTLAIAQSPNRYDYDEARIDAILAQLVSCKLGANPVEIASDVLSKTESNMRPEVLNDILKRVGIENYWGTVGKQLPVQRLLSESDDVACVKAAKARLTDLMNLRNRIAHPTGATTFPSPEEVSQELDFLEVLAQVADDVAAMRVTAFAPV